MAVMVTVVPLSVVVRGWWPSLRGLRGRPGGTAVQQAPVGRMLPGAVVSGVSWPGGRR